MRRTVAAVLLLLMCVIAVTASAESIYARTLQTPVEPSIIEEVISLRGEYEKHYKMSDGSYMAFAYEEPVHHIKDGQWHEIDNTLNSVQMYNGSKRIQNTDGLMNVSFSQDMGGELVSLENSDGQEISWNLYGLNGQANNFSASASQKVEFNKQAHVEVADLNAADDSDEAMVNADKSVSQLLYQNAITQAINVEYTVLPTRVKEAIILNTRPTVSRFVMDITAENLSARLLDNRQIEFYDGDKVAFVIWAPYMYDAAGELSEDIMISLDGENGKYTVTLQPNEEWLNASDRVYPIVIDPDVSTSQDQANGIDNSVEEGSGVITHTLDRLYAGKRSGKIRRAYQKFKNMPTIPSSATINSATQTLYVTSGTSTGNSINVYKVDKDWNSTSITWANKPSASTAIQTGVGHNSLTKYSINMKSAVQSWYSGSTTGKNKNYGIMIRYANESINDFNTVYSADFATTSKRPQLKINYTASGGGTNPTPTPSGSTAPGYNLVNNEVYYIKNKFSGQYLTVSGTNVVQKKFSGSTSQRWRLQSIGGGECKIYSMSNTGYVLNVLDNSSSNGKNIRILQNSNVTGSKFKIMFNSDNVTHRIASKSSSFSSAVAVEGASCSENANVIQWQYNKSANDEWIFEPRSNFSALLARQYAHSLAKSQITTYPRFDSDCANFVSQCMLAGGVHFQDQWYIYKKNNNRPDPSDAEVHLSWEFGKIGSYLGFGGSSPWFSARQFNNFWKNRVHTETYSAAYVRDNQQEIYERPFQRGDVIQTLTKDGEPIHTVFICCIGSYNGKPDYNLSYHSNDTKDKPLGEFVRKGSSSIYLRFFKMR